MKTSGWAYEKERQMSWVVKLCPYTELLNTIAKHLVLLPVRSVGIATTSCLGVVRILNSVVLNVFQLISNFERDMSEALEALRQEKDNAQQRIDELNHKVKYILVYIKCNRIISLTNCFDIFLCNLHNQTNTWVWLLSHLSMPICHTFMLAYLSWQHIHCFENTVIKKC